MKEFLPKIVTKDDVDVESASDAARKATLAMITSVDVEGHLTVCRSGTDRYPSLAALSCTLDYPRSCQRAG